MLPPSAFAHPLRFPSRVPHMCLHSIRPQARREAHVLRARDRTRVGEVTALTVRPLRALLVLAVGATSFLAIGGGAVAHAASTSNQSACRLVSAAAHPKVVTTKPKKTKATATNASKQVEAAIQAALQAPNADLRSLARTASAALKRQGSKPKQSLDLSSAAAFAALLKGCGPYLG